MYIVKDVMDKSCNDEMLMIDFFILIVIDDGIWREISVINMLENVASFAIAQNSNYPLKQANECLVTFSNGNINL